MRNSDLVFHLEAILARVKQRHTAVARNMLEALIKEVAREEHD